MTQAEEVAILLVGFDEYPAVNSSNVMYGQYRFCGRQGYPVLFASEDMRKNYAGRKEPLICTRPKGHTGPHVAHVTFDGEAIGVIE